MYVQNNMFELDLMNCNGVQWYSETIAKVCVNPKQTYVKYLSSPRVSNTLERVIATLNKLFINYLHSRRWGQECAAKPKARLLLLPN